LKLINITIFKDAESNVNLVALNMPRIRAVLFDLGGTLVRTASTSEIFMRILRKHDVHIPSERICGSFPEVIDEMSLESFKLPYKEFWRIYNIKILKRLGIKENLKELADTLTSEWWENADLEIYSDVEETLNRLRQRKLKIGIISNGFKIDIHEILSRTGLENKFDVLVGVDDVGKPKPHKEIFLYALKNLHRKPHESLFVGDNPHTDYFGAEAAGLNPLLIDRDSKIQGRYRRIRDLREIINYL